MNKKYEISCLGSVLNVYEDCAGLTQKGALGFLSKGLAGERYIYYKDLSGVQFKEAGWTQGFIEFIFPGSNTSTGGGALVGMNNSNRFTFGGSTIAKAREINDQMITIRDYIQKRINEIKNPPASRPVVSVADELMKFKQLLDAGLITRDEFDRKKKELLKE